MELRFVFKSTSGKPRVHSKRLPVIVGRSDAPDVKLRIPKDSISRRHCEFFLDDEGRVCLRDLESTNGTFLDGHQLEPRVAAVLRPGHMVMLGDVGFRIEYEVEGASKPAHDSDTIPIEAAATPVDIGALEPAGGTPPTEPLADQAVAEEPPATADFGFLAAADEAAAEAWPDADDAPAQGDTGLEEFLKGLP